MNNLLQQTDYERDLNKTRGDGFFMECLWEV